MKTPFTAVNLKITAVKSPFARVKSVLTPPLQRRGHPFDRPRRNRPFWAGGERGMRDERKHQGGAPLPLEARRALWNRIWDRLLAPEDLRDQDEVPAHGRKDAPFDRRGSGVGGAA